MLILFIIVPASKYLRDELESFIILLYIREFAEFSTFMQLKFTKCIECWKIIVRSKQHTIKMDTYIIPSPTRSLLSSLFNTTRSLLIVIGPANCNKLATVAKTPAKIKVKPKNFLNAVNKRKGYSGLRLQNILANRSAEYVGS